MVIRRDIYEEIKAVKFDLVERLMDTDDAVEALVMLLAEAEADVKKRGGMRHLIAVRAVLEAGYVIETMTDFEFMMPPTFAACEMVAVVKREIRKFRRCKVDLRREGGEYDRKL